MKRHIPYGHQSIDEEDIEEVINVLRSAWITQGPKVQEFEESLADYCGVKYCVAFSSGTAALHAAYFAGDIGQGDEIVTSPITFAATANAAFYLGARPVFVDIEKDTANLNPDLLEKAITERTKAIVPVHFAGQPVDLDKILSIASKKGLIVIEDACHALGARYKNKKIGSVSDLTIFSFHPVKTITAGEGGAVLTNREDLFEKMVMFRNHGATKDRKKMSDYQGDWFYEMHCLGYNYRITDFQCALGISQMKKLDDFVLKRRQIVSEYNRAFASLNTLEPLCEKQNRVPAWHIYVVRLRLERLQKSRRDIFDYLRSRGIGVQVHYIPVYWHPYYQDQGYTKGLCPAAEDYYERAITLPLYPSMENEEIRTVVEEVKRVVG